MKFNKLIMSMGLAAAVLSGCNDSDLYNEDVTISGSAVKGALKNALVIACKPTQSECVEGDVDAVQVLTGAAAPLAKTLTDENGEYTLTMTYEGAVILRTLATAETTQKCDYTGCDETAGLEGLELKTIAYADPVATSSALSNVTAPMNVLTSLATAAQLEIGVSNDIDTFKAQSDAASKVVADLLGLDLGSSETVNLFEIDLPSATADDLADATGTTQQLALVNASFGALTTGATLAESISAVSNAVSSVVADSIDGDAVDAEAVTVLAGALTEMASESESQIEEIASQAAELGLTVEVTAPVLNDNVEATVASLDIEVPEDTNSATETETGTATGTATGTGTADVNQG